eukprot:Gregarina_sp_Poly_1__6837@NODE_36_length_18572_cov_139_626047_g31_i0_p1_GENE_NODE_36_length_18572_cov_139_626047_g31_i0NODE_36_length_18572_cov_139_626047_g31_i0_p1_ORF_typecomplete_len1815_score257_46POR_N/PF01855_19/5_3e53FAD_binding_1/PF00667_20/2e03FAD_binding_1/PF00667_20/1_3e03FAD_binding_1/PF00667_20/2e52POR/PF01558_18/8_1e42POR/PF01558_18/2_3e03Flavodoxin_1/PF00258_25/3_5e33PFOR_II/PF17147_4/6_9e20NAD_binding_1/PF00175_21/9_2e16Fer4_16/PF13484_6/9_7e14TPP_enzyme_C/PF02775_21/2_7e12EKR/PF
MAPTSTNIPPITSETETELLNYPVEDVIDGCTAAAHIAYACSDAAFIYPITPSSAMAEMYEVWAAHHRLNIYGHPCSVTQLQSEAGAAGAVHGSLSVGAVTTTFTASQGLLLMIPPMYKIAGELLPCVFHVSARAVAGQALSIFGDHSDVMAVRQCGWSLLSSASVQEAQDMALIAHMATLEARVPFVHFFDGFRTSHELQKIKLLNYKTVRDMMDFDYIEAFRRLSLNPTHPYLKGSAQGPDVYFQNLEVANKFYKAVPELVEKYMMVFGKATGRHYRLFDYYGPPEAEDIFVVMGAGGPVVEEVIDYLSEWQQEYKVGVVTIKLFRPWNVTRFLEALPSTTRRVCVLDRTKEPGALGEPLFLDVAASLHCSSGHHSIKCVGGRFGLGSKDFSPAMVMAALDNLRSEDPKHGFTLGIIDDLTGTSLDFSKYHLNTVPSGTTQCMFWGMGSDGTVGANKNVIKILGQNTSLNVQGYFAYSAHKAGGLTVSHLRFGPKPIKSQYLLQNTDYVAVHRAAYIQKYDCLKTLNTGGTFVLNTSSIGEDIEKEMPPHVKHFLAKNGIKFYVIDANKVAAENGMGRRINNVLMTAFFKLSGVLPFEEAIGLFKSAIQKTYGKKGSHIVEANWKCVDAAVSATREILYDKKAWAQFSGVRSDEKQWTLSKAIADPPTFVQGVMLALERMDGDALPTSAFEEFAGGVIPPGTAGFEKRAIALNVPVVDMDKCTQCNQCSFVCPHAAIRPFLLDEEDVEKAPEGFVTKKAKGTPALAPFKYRIQVSPFDCTGCELCYIACPDDALAMIPLEEATEVQEPCWEFAIALPDRADCLEAEQRFTLKGSQFYTPMMEFSGACEGCGETPYVKLLTQLFGERLIIANATGCSSIWGASYPANAYTVNQKGFGPAWGNSLFEDNAEYGYGMAVATSQRRQYLRDEMERALSDENVTSKISMQLRSMLSEWLLNWCDAVVCQKVFEQAKPLLEEEAHVHASVLFIKNNADLLPRLSQWIVGGDGWAFDIGFGGLDHVVASGVDVNILVLDTEVYSNTGGQQSKATTMGAVHKFASGGRLRNKKDLGAICIEYGDVYVASCASSANMTQTVRAFVEAEAWHGPSVILAYSPCIEHQYIKPFNLQIEHCKLAVESGYWPLYRYNPALIDRNENPFQLDCRKIKADIMDLMKKENRFGTLRRLNPKMAEDLEIKLKIWALERFQKYQTLAAGPTAMSAPTTADLANQWNVLYGTETGNAEEVARRIGMLMKERHTKAVVSQMDEIGVEELVEMKNVIIVCSTAGQGELPGNAKELYHALEKETNQALLSTMRFAVVGLGDSNYVYFNQAAKLFDALLSRLGAMRIMDTCMGDDQHEERFETALADWLPAFWEEAKIAEPENVPTEPSPCVFSVLPMDAKVTPQYHPICHHGGVMINLKRNSRMTPTGYDVDIRHLEFDLLETKVKYALGDSLAIFPKNSESDVVRLCEEYEWNPDQWIEIEPNDKSNTGGAKYSAVFKHPMTIRQLLVEGLDVFGKPNRTFYENFWRYCTEDGEKSKARTILNKENRDVFLHWTSQETVRYCDVFRKFPSCKRNITLPHLIDLVPLIKPRYYSIASAQKFVGPQELHLCVGIVEWDTVDGQHRFGQATGYLARSQCDLKHIPMCTSIKATAFNLPPADTYPIIIAAMGTGLAPFRAFMQHRAFVKKSGKSQVGPMTVYFGCRYSKKDYLYKEELEDWHKSGVISDLKVAFSREQKQKHYIQHEMVNDPQLLYRRLVIEDGYFYLCGSAKQVPIDVRNAVRKVLCMEGSMSEQAAEDLVTQWQIKGKYNVEAWS